MCCLKKFLCCYKITILLVNFNQMKDILLRLEQNLYEKNLKNKGDPHEYAKTFSKISAMSQG